MSCLLRKIRTMLHAVQREGAPYGLQLKITTDAGDPGCVLVRAGCAAKLPAPNLRDLEGRILATRDSAFTLGFMFATRPSIPQILRKRAGILFARMNQYKLIWRAHLPLRRILDKYYSLAVAKAMSGVHMLAVSDTQFSYLEYAHSRCLRRILNLKAAWRNRISHADIRKRAGTRSLLFYVRSKQYARLGHILRRPANDPDRLALFEPGTGLKPRIPVTPLSLSDRKKYAHGRPRGGRADHLPWAAPLLAPLLAEYSGDDIIALAQDKDSWYMVTHRLCIQRDK